MTNKNVPKLRFKENSHLRETTLGGICKFFKGKGISKNDLSEKGTPCIRYGELYTTYNEIVTEIKERTNLNKNDLVLSSKNDVLLPCSGETAIDLGNATCVLKDGVALGGDITIIKTKENGVFLSYYLNYKRTKLAKYAQGISIMHLYPKYFKKMTLSIPPIDEQEKIASFLYNIDKKIGLLKGKKDEYVKFKQYLLQNLFPQNDEKTPKLRFNQFTTNNWKTVTLVECVTCLDSERKPLNEEKRRKNRGVFPYYGANGLVDHINQYIFNDTLVLLAEDGGFFNEYTEKPIAQLVNGKIWVNNHAHVLKNKNNLNITFLYYSLVHKDIRKYINGTSRSKLNQKDMFSIVINITSIEEQKKIASFLSFVDKKIDLLDQEIEQVEEYKKGLLQKMFI